MPHPSHPPNLTINPPGGPPDPNHPLPPNAPASRHPERDLPLHQRLQHRLLHLHGQPAAAAAPDARQRPARAAVPRCEMGVGVASGRRWRREG